MELDPYEKRLTFDVAFEFYSRVLRDFGASEVARDWIYACAGLCSPQTYKHYRAIAVSQILASKDYVYAFYRYGNDLPYILTYRSHDPIMVYGIVATVTPGTIEEVGEAHAGNLTFELSNAGDVTYLVSAIAFYRYEERKYGRELREEYVMSANSLIEALIFRNKPQGADILDKWMRFRAGTRELISIIKPEPPYESGEVHVSAKSPNIEALKYMPLEEENREFLMEVLQDWRDVGIAIVRTLPYVVDMGENYVKYGRSKIGYEYSFIWGVATDALKPRSTCTIHIYES